MIRDVHYCRRILPSGGNPPISVVVAFKHSQHVLQDLIHLLCLTVCLWMVCITELNLTTKPHKEGFPKCGCKF